MGKLTYVQIRDRAQFKTQAVFEKIWYVWAACIFTSHLFLKMAGGIVLGSVAVSAVSAISADISPYISVAIKASFFKFAMCNICKNNIAKMFLEFFKI